MSESASRTLLRTALALGVLAVISLLAPWGASGRVDRSLFGLVASASALDVLSGFNKFLVVAALVFVVFAVAVGIVGAAWQRMSLVASAMVGLGPVLLAAAITVGRSPISLRWGAIFSAVAGMGASACVIIVGVAQSRRRSNLA